MVFLLYGEETFSLEQLPIDIISVSLFEKEDSRTVDSAKDGKMNALRNKILNICIVKKKPLIYNF